MAKMKSRKTIAKRGQSAGNARDPNTDRRKNAQPIKDVINGIDGDAARHWNAGCPIEP